MKHDLQHAFTAAELDLAEQSCAPGKLKCSYQHLRDVPLHSFNKVKPMLLIGCDNPHLITPVSPVQSGPIGGPEAVCTALGWSVQGPTSCNICQVRTAFFIRHSYVPLKSYIRMWRELDTLPFRDSEEVIPSGECKVL